MEPIDIICSVLSKLIICILLSILPVSIALFVKDIVSYGSGILLILLGTTPWLLLSCILCNRLISYIYEKNTKIAPTVIQARTSTEDRIEIIYQDPT